MRNPLNSLSRDGAGPWIGTWTNSPETRVGSHPRPSSQSTGGKGEYIAMGSLIFIAITALLILTGCLEGGRRNSSYSNEVSNIPVDGGDPSWYASARKSDYTESVGYPKNGAFSKDVKQLRVHTEEEFVSAITEQNGPLVLTIAGNIFLSQSVVVRQPIVIRTTEEFGTPNSSLSFVRTSETSFGELAIDNPNYQLDPMTMNCGVLAGILPLFQQMFVRLEGNISHPIVRLKSKTHFVVDLSRNNTLTIENFERDSTIVVVGNPQVIAMNRADGRWVFVQRHGITDRSLRAAIEPNSPQMFINSWVSDLDRGSLPHANDSKCYDRNGLIGLVDGLYGEPEGRSRRAEFGIGNQLRCETNGWANESLRRAMCSTRETEGAQ